MKPQPSHTCSHYAKADPKLEDRYYRTLVERDGYLFGHLLRGRQDDVVVCIPTCRARKPRRENVEFYTGRPDRQ